MAEDGIIYVGKRVHCANLLSYDSSCVPIVPSWHIFAELYVRYVHNISHSGVDATVSRIRQHFWMPKLNKLVARIVSSCKHCKLRRGVVEEQQMAPLPMHRLLPAPAWHSTNLDYFGPFMIRGAVNKRSRGKVYGLIFTCSVSRAVHLDIAADYTKEGLLLVLRRFIALRG